MSISVFTPEFSMHLGLVYVTYMVGHESFLVLTSTVLIPNRFQVQPCSLSAGMHAFCESIDSLSVSLIIILLPSRINNSFSA